MYDVKQKFEVDCVGIGVRRANLGGIREPLSPLRTHHNFLPLIPHYGAYAEYM